MTERGAKEFCASFAMTAFGKGLTLPSVDVACVKYLIVHSVIVLPVSNNQIIFLWSAMKTG